MTNDPFVMHHRSLMESPAWRALSGEGHKVLHRIEIEHMRHGGKDNGALIVTYGNFQEYGIGTRRTIGRGIREAVALGLLQAIRGRAGNGEFKSPNQYRLTYLPTHQNGIQQPPTDEWLTIKDIDDARTRAQAAKNPRKRSQWLIGRAAKVVPFFQ